LCLIIFSIGISTSKTMGSGASGSAVCFSFSDNIDPMHIQLLRKMIPPPTQYSVGVKNLIAFFILYYISCRLVTILKAIDVHILIPDIFLLTVCFKFIKFKFQISSCLILKYLLASWLTFFRLPILLWFVSCNHCILACFLGSKNC